MSLEATIAKTIHEIGFPPKARERLGEHYDGVLDQFVEQAGTETCDLPNAVYQAEKTGDPRLIADIGRKALDTSPKAAYNAGKASGDTGLKTQAEDEMLKRGDLTTAYRSATGDGRNDSENFDEEFLDKIFPEAIKTGHKRVYEMAMHHKKVTGSDKRLRQVGRGMLESDPRGAYMMAKETKDETLKTEARRSWVENDHAEAFEYGFNGAIDLELAKLAVEHSTEGIKASRALRFLTNHQPENQELIQEMRKRVIDEEPRLAGSLIEDEKGDEALKDPRMSIGRIHQRAQETGKEETWRILGRRVSEKTGLPPEKVVALYRGEAEASTK